MPLNIGNSKIGTLYLGSTKIDSVYLGSTKLYQAAHASSWNGFILQIKWSPEKNDNIAIQGLKADGAALTTSDIEQGKCSVNGTESSLSSSEISDALTGSLTKYCSLIEFWIKKPDAKSLTYHTNQYYQPSGTCLVNIWKYDSSGNTQLVVEDEQVTMAVNTDYTFNV